VEVVVLLGAADAERQVVAAVDRPWVRHKHSPPKLSDRRTYYPPMSRHADLFTDIDSMDADAFARHLTEDVRFTFGNSDTVVGRDNVRDVWAGFCEGIDGVRHEVIEQFETGSATIVESTVTYTRKDGTTIALPVVTIYRGAGELIDDYRIFMDVAPLFAAP
jgi:limonene-1,2-epoxide hydrolase